MIKAIFFDFYNTLVRFWPPLAQIQQASCQEFGFHLDQESLSYGYSVADIYFNRQNEIKPLALRSEEERLDFFSRYEQVLLENAGLPVSLDLARQVWQVAISVPKDFVTFDDTLESLERLKGKGYSLGVISNLRRDMNQLCDNLGMAPYLDFCLTSAEIGVEKPDPAIFVAALKRAGVKPSEALHVGDQPRSDMVGARGAGLHAILLDRGGWHTEIENCVQISRLDELDELLAHAPESLLLHKSEPGVSGYYPDEQAAG